MALHPSFCYLWYKAYTPSSLTANLRRKDDRAELQEELGLLMLLALNFSSIDFLLFEKKRSSQLI